MYPVIRFAIYFRRQVLLIFLSHLKGIVPEEALSGNKDVKLAGKSWYEYNLNNHLMSLWQQTLSNFPGCIPKL